MTTAPADGRPATRGTKLDPADPDLALVGAPVMGPDDRARARPWTALIDRTPRFPGSHWPSRGNFQACARSHGA